MARLRPYLYQTTYQWIVDHGLTPYCLVDAELEGVEVPWQFVEDGQILFDISPVAVQALSIDNHAIDFTASFSGEPWDVHLPIDAVIAVYALETEQGLYATDNNLGLVVNEGEPGDLDPNPTPSGDDDSSQGSGDAQKRRAGFKVVK